MAEVQNSPQAPTSPVAEEAQAAQDMNAQTEGVVENVPETEDDTAEPKQYYIVEVILFKHLNEEGKLDEFWHHPDSLNESSELINDPMMLTTPSLTDDTPALAEYSLINHRFLPLSNGVAALSSTNYKLADSAAHLRYSKDFKLLAHFGWTQLSLAKDQALPILITSDQFSDSLLPSGHLKLYVSRYLHMQVDLSSSSCEPGLTDTVARKKTLDDTLLDKQLENGTSELEKPVRLQQGNIALTDKTVQIAMSGRTLSEGATPIKATPKCVNNTYLFKQQRKMRSKELHYLDNPLYGLLVYVTPYLVNSDETAGEKSE